MRLGLRVIRGLSNADGAKIVSARSTTAYDCVEDVWRRSGAQRVAIEKLADGDAFHSFGADRRQGLWKVRGLGEAPLPLFAAADRAGRDTERGRDRARGAATGADRRARGDRGLSQPPAVAPRSPADVRARRAATPRRHPLR